MINHPKSDVQSKKIGHNTVIWQYSVVLSGATIGDNCNINSYCFIENDVYIGNNVTIKCGVFIWDGVTIEDNVYVGPNAVFTNDLFPRSKQEFRLYNTIVKRGASIGANATILAGITIGEFALIGAGSVVVKNVPNNTIWIGNPSRQIGFICNCGQKLNETYHCNCCNSDYRLVDSCIIKQ